MDTIVGPVTKKVHVVKYGGYQMGSLYERIKGKDKDDKAQEKGRNTTMEKYGCTVARWWQLWNVERIPEPEGSEAGDKLLIDLFGDFRAKDYAAKNMVKLYFVGNPEIPFGRPVSSSFSPVNWPPGEQEDRDGKKYPDSYIVVHRKVVGPYTRALARVFEFAAKGTYALRTFHSYAPRNKVTKNEPGQPKKKGKASNHTLGIALDINAKQNWYDEYVWDMPPEIVQIFLEEGFYWGGIYQNHPDAMHFEFKLPFVPTGKAPPTRVTFPLGPAYGGILESPVAYYHNNESVDTGIGGYYGLGLRRNLHGGVHLFPETGDAAASVNAIAPGYLVAARLPRPGDDPRSRAVLSLLQNWPGFVLLRHDLSLLSPKAAEGTQPERTHFYSLYVHLAPFDAALGEDQPYFQHVPWFREALKRRYGCWVKITTDGSDPPGTTLWAKAPVSPQDTRKSYPVFDRDEEIVVRAGDGPAQWLFKAPPSDFSKVIEALTAGKLVTFTEPFFPIKTAGEPIGLAQALPTDQMPYRQGYIARGRDERIRLGSGFLHWEVFGPVHGGKSAIRDVLQLARECFPELGEVLADSNEISETTPDNFLDLDEIKQKVLPRLPPDHRVDLETSIAALEAGKDLQALNPYAYGKALLDLFAKAESFAPQSPGDATGKLVDEEFTYPIALQIELDHMVRPDQLADGGPYELLVEYFAALKPTLGKVGKKGKATPMPTRGASLGKQKLVIAADKWKPEDDPLGTGKILKLTLRVPAAAVSVVLHGAKNVVATEPKKAAPVGTDLFRTLVPPRFRGTRLTHLTEWAPKAVELLADKLKKNNLLPQDFDPTLMYSLSWWHKEGFSVTRWLASNSPWAKKTETQSPSAVSLVEPPKEEALVSITHKGDASVFGDGPEQLPVDAIVDNFHPVTFLWLLAMLRGKDLAAAKPKEGGGAAAKPPLQAQAIDFQVPERALFNKEDPEPLAWGWVAQSSGPPQLGDEAPFLVIDDDYGYDPKVLAEVGFEVDGRKLQVPLRMAYGENGVIAASVEVDFWGKCKLVVGDKDKPKRTFGPTTIDVAGPQFADSTPQDAQRGAYVPRRVGNRMMWPIKVPKGAKVSRRVRGFVGVQISANGMPWQDAKLGGKTPMIPAEAVGLPTTADPSIASDAFEFRDSFIIDLLPNRKEADPQVTPGFRHSQYQNAYRDLLVSCSLVQGMHELLVAHPGLSIIRLSRDGRGCVVRPGRWPAARAVAEWCLGAPYFKEVAIWPSKAKLSAADISLDNPKAAEIGKAMQTGGLLLTVEETSPKRLCKDLVVGNVVTTPDDLFITGMVGDATSITPRIKAADLYCKAPAVISLRLAQGLQALLGESKQKTLKLVSLGREGDSCVVDAASLLPQAIASPWFASAEIVGQGKAKALALYAPGSGSVAVTFDPVPLLQAIRLEAAKAGLLAKEGQTMAYRYTFCAVNGYSKLAPSTHGFAREGYAFEEELLKFRKVPPMAVTACCTSPSGTLRAMGFGVAKVRLIEERVVVDIPLLGNASHWHGIKLKASIAGAKTSPKVTLASEGGAVRIETKVPKENSFDLTVEVDKNADMANATVPPAHVTADLTPRLIPDPSTKGLAVAPIGDYVVVWCSTNGLRAPDAGALGLPFVHPSGSLAGQLGTIAGVCKSKHGTALELVISPNDILADKRKPKLQAAIEYYLPGAERRFGFVTHDGIFAARIPKSVLRPDRKYGLTLRQKGAVRSPTLAELQGEIKTDVSFGTHAGEAP